MTDSMFAVRVINGHVLSHGHHLTHYVMHPRMYVHGIDERCVETVVIKNDKNEWWIMSEHFEDDDYFEPVGPFVKPDDAVIHLRLLAYYQEEP